MRGKERLHAFCIVLCGITPAYAGKRSISTILFFTNWDHPRLCGEKISQKKVIIAWLGSPPPMRGKGNKEGRNIDFAGITPAYAGKSSAFIRSSPVNQDHPRLCGEKSTEKIAYISAAGSPPPMRGKDFLSVL